MAEPAREAPILRAVEGMPREKGVSMEHPESLALPVRRVQVKGHRCAAGDPFEVVHVLAERTGAIDLLQSDDVRVRAPNERGDRVQVTRESALADERRRPGPTRTVRHVEGHDAQRVSLRRVSHGRSMTMPRECSPIAP